VPAYESCKYVSNKQGSEVVALKMIFLAHKYALKNFKIRATNSTKNQKYAWKNIKFIRKKLNVVLQFYKIVGLIDDRDCLNSWIISC